MTFLVNCSFLYDCIRNYIAPRQLQPSLFYAALERSADILRSLPNDTRFDVNERNESHDSGATVFMRVYQLGHVTDAEILLSLPPERNLDRFAATDRHSTPASLDTSQQPSS